MENFRGLIPLALVCVVVAVRWKKDTDSRSKSLGLPRFYWYIAVEVCAALGAALIVYGGVNQ